MTIARIAASVGLVGMALLGGAATAAADTGHSSPSAPRVGGDYPRVKAWHDVNARQVCAATTCAIDPLWSMKAGDTRQGICWRQGETITYGGITNDIWIVISLEDGLSRNVSAVYLEGDKYANLPASSKCGPWVK